MKSRISMPALALGAAFTAITLLVTPAQAGVIIDQLPQTDVTPPVSLESGQTVRVHFLNVGTRPFELAPCFFDADGQHLKMGRAVTLQPGQTRWYDLSRAEAGPPELAARVRAGVHAEPTSLRQLVVSSEVLDDATGRTLLLVPGLGNLRHSPDDTLLTLGSEEPLRILAPVAITDGQTLRLNLLNQGARPIEINPCYLDADGQHLKMGDPFTLRPGETRSFEITRAEAGPPEMPRALVIGGAHVRAADAASLLVTGEVPGREGLYVLPGASIGLDAQAGPPEGR